jgi:large subunit ribosomal protein L22
MPEKTFRASHRGSPVTPRKARYVVDLVRGKPVSEALDILKYCPRRAAPLLSKVVMSALANAQQDPDVDHNRLHLIDVRADDGATVKRWTPRSRGQMYPLLLRYSHLTVVLAEREAKERRQRGGADRSRRARVAASRAARTDSKPEATSAEQENA